MDPLCPHFGTCGGCRFQHIPYEEQLAQKQELVAHAFSEVFPYVDPILGCQPPWHYRNKMEFSFSQSREGARFLGLMQRGKRGRVVSLEACILSPSWFVEVLDSVRLWWEASGLDAYFPPADRGTLRTLTLREGKRTGEKMAVLTFSGDAPIDEEGFARALEPHALTTAVLRKQIAQKKVPTRFEEKVLFGPGSITEKLYSPDGTPLSFQISPASFFQPNTEQAERIYTLALEIADLSGEETLFDLYCGTGTIGMFASSSVKEVVGIELSPEMALDAKRNIARNGIKNMEVIAGDVGEALPKKLNAALPSPEGLAMLARDDGADAEQGGLLCQESVGSGSRAMPCLRDEEGWQSPSKTRIPDVILVDPPRAGLAPRVVQQLTELRSPKLIYISCNPISQAKNVKELVEFGYEVVRIQPVDQFPHTPHVENIVALQHKL